MTHETKHTEGPWHVNAAIRNRLYVETDSLFICDMQFQDASEDDKETIEANARLIAASPELLDAVMQVLRASEDNGDMNDIDWNQLRSAARKAGALD